MTPDKVSTEMTSMDPVAPAFTLKQTKPVDKGQMTAIDKHDRPASRLLAKGHKKKAKTSCSNRGVGPNPRSLTGRKR
jgi:hypothetical protein